MKKKNTTFINGVRKASPSFIGESLALMTQISAFTLYLLVYSIKGYEKVFNKKTQEEAPDLPFIFPYLYFCNF